MTTTKQCSSCGEHKPLTEFSKQTSSKSGYRSLCKQCVSIRSALYYSKNSDKLKTKTREWYAENKESASSYGKVWREKNATYVKISKAEYEKKNREKFRLAAAKWRDKNRAKVNAKSRMQAKKNPDRYRAHCRNRAALKLSAEGKHTAEQVTSIYAKQNGLCNYCKAHLNGKYHADHIIPLTRGGTNYASNIQCLCPSCNMSKSNMMPWEYFEYLERKAA